MTSRISLLNGKQYFISFYGKGGRIDNRAEQFLATFKSTRELVRNVKELVYANCEHEYGLQMKYPRKCGKCGLLELAKQ